MENWAPPLLNSMAFYHYRLVSKCKYHLICSSLRRERHQAKASFQIGCRHVILLTQGRTSHVTHIHTLHSVRRIAENETNRVKKKKMMMMMKKEKKNKNSQPTYLITQALAVLAEYTIYKFNSHMMFFVKATTTTTTTSMSSTLTVPSPNHHWPVCVRLSG